MSRLVEAIPPDNRGKVRDLWDLGDELLLVTSDRLSAFDVILGDPIPYKGEVLTKLSLFWFDLLSGVVKNHLITADVTDLPERFAPYADELRGRFMIVTKAEVFPFECIVRGYLAGSGLAEYNREGTVCGIPLPEGLVNSSRLEQPIFTPSTKADLGEHDQNVSYGFMEEAIGSFDAKTLRDQSLAVYAAARDHAASRGIIIADTKFEFGAEGNRVILIDEVLTPDSSRFWPLAYYAPGADQPSFDKQFIRDWLEASGWDKQAPAPSLPQDVIAATTAKYIQAYELITGQRFVPESLPY